MQERTRVGYPVAKWLRLKRRCGTFKKILVRRISDAEAMNLDSVRAQWYRSTECPGQSLSD